MKLKTFGIWWAIMTFVAMLFADPQVVSDVFAVAFAGLAMTIGGLAGWAMGASNNGTR